MNGKKKQHLTIEIHDHRSGETQTETYNDHSPFLRRMKELAREEAHMAEATKAVVHLLPLPQGGLFQGETGTRMEERLEQLSEGLDPSPGPA